MSSKYFFAYLVLVFCTNFSVSAQPKTNYQIVDSLIGFSAYNLAESLENDKIYKLNFESADEYKVLKSSIIKSINENGKRCKEDTSSEGKIIYVLEEAMVNYSEIFKDGIFGNFLVSRTSEIRGKYLLAPNQETSGNYNNFKYSFTDTLLYSEISKVENIAYPFTTSNMPEEPFFSSLLEPAIAVGTAAIAVYLFFNIRSK